MRTLTDLASDMDKLAASLGNNANEVSKEVARVIVTDLTQITPADTGAAISNWQVSIGAPIEAQIPPHSPSPRGRMVKGVWTHSVDPQITKEANAPIALAEAMIQIDEKQPGEALFITNVVPYIERLDEGSSQQAPAGFVDRAIILGRTVVDRMKKLL